MTVARRPRAWIAWGVRAAITMAAFAWVFRTIDRPRLVEALSHTDLRGLGFAGAVYLATFLACAVRWHLLLIPVQRIPFHTVLRWSLLGAFFNTLLPTTIGGDVVRWYEARRATGQPARTAATIFLDRLIGFTAMFAIGWVAALLARHHLHHPAIRGGLLGLAVVFLVVTAGFLNRRLYHGVIAPLRWLRWSRAHDALVELRDTLSAYGAHPWVIAAAAGLSVGIQLASMAIYGIVGGAMGLALPWWAVMVFVPILAMIAMLPISLNGFGIREAAAILLFSAVGISEPNAVALSLICGVLPALSGLWGAAVFLKYRRAGEARLLADAEV